MEPRAIAVAMRVATTSAGGEDCRLTSSSMAANSFGETLRARRATTRTRNPARAPGSSGFGGGNCSGRQTSDRSSAKANPSGRTPTMVCERPPRTIWRPIAAGSEPSFARQNASLTIASGWPTSFTSNVRPRAGATPSSVSNPGVTSVALTPSAAPSPVSVMFVGSYPSIAASRGPRRASSARWGGGPARSRQPSNVSYLTERGAAPRSSGRTSPRVTRALGSANGGGVSSTASTTAKIAVPAPIVSDSVKTAAPALAGERRRVSQQVTKVDEHW